MANSESDVFEDPTFGRVTLDQWNTDFWTLWKFSCFRPFPEHDESPFDGIDSRHIALIENWGDSIQQLARICRRSNVHYALRYRGLCELSIGRTAGQPIHDDQRAAFEAFAASETDVTDTVLDAIVDYYHGLDEYERDDPLECLSDAELAHFANGVDRSNIERICAFDGISVSRVSSTNPVSLCFGFEAHWDFEHGFGVVWRDGQIVGCGNSDAVSYMMGSEY